MFTWVDVCSTQPLCRGIQSAFRRVTHQRPRRCRRRRVYFGPFRNDPENNGWTKSLLDRVPPTSVCRYGYPDASYLARVRDELAAKGITSARQQQSASSPPHPSTTTTSTATTSSSSSRSRSSASTARPHVSSTTVGALTFAGVSATASASGGRLYPQLPRTSGPLTTPSTRHVDISRQSSAGAQSASYASESSRANDSLTGSGTSV